MFKIKNKKINQDVKLYNKILFLSRNNIFYTKFCVTDTFQNRIILIFFHISFILINLKINSISKNHKKFSQNMFDLTFKKIEQNMRELGYGDVSVNQNMKFLVKTFYNILLECEDYKKITTKRKKLFLFKYLAQNSNINDDTEDGIVKYFNKYQAFCFDFNLDSVLSGDLNFKYN